MSEAGWLPVGRLKRTRGNRGELIAEIYSQQPGRAERLKKVMLESAGRTRLVEVEQFWTHDGRPVFKFSGIDSISEAHLTRREVSESINCFLDQFERQLLGRYFSGQRRRLT